MLTRFATGANASERSLHASEGTLASTVVVVDYENNVTVRDSTIDLDGSELNHDFHCETLLVHAAERTSEVYEFRPQRPRSTT